MSKRKIDNDGDACCSKKQDTNSTKISQYFSPRRLKYSFYDQTGKDFARALLGKKLVCIKDGERISGMIVETEAYLGSIDKAAHSYNGKRTNKTEAMFMKPGTAYVYYIYGSYCCMNISNRGEGCAVLLRAVEPIEGKEKMNKFRWKEESIEKTLDKIDKKTGKIKLTKKEKDLSNGPSKLCQALNITKVEINKEDLTESENIWLEEGQIIPDSQIVNSKRININNAEDWRDKLLRFYILNNDFISVRDKEAEGC